ncbi:hypothetical protein [Clostridium sp.]|uniref:hypothetical protein n=1 Tax=Clostridium sp. TaxID=1506 RepID=UPI0026064322|nr:hypothetical protein [Clostridium sp.]
MNIKYKFISNNIISENPLHSSTTVLSNLSSFMNNHNQSTLDNLIFNDHLYDNQIK